MLKRARSTSMASGGDPVGVWAIMVAGAAPESLSNTLSANSVVRAGVAAGYFVARHHPRSIARQRRIGWRAAGRPCSLARFVPLEKPIEIGVDHWHDDQREQRRGYDPADDGATHGSLRLAALAQSECERQHAEDHGGSGHQDRAQPDLSGREQRVV